MPSSLIIVALAAAWLAVLVPMIARKRQAIARTTDSALAARVVRSGHAREEFATSEPADPVADSEEFEDDFEDEPARAPRPALPEPASAPRYRPGRGGFDPEAAEIAARAKYAYRQRVVLGLLIAVVLSAVAAGFVWSKLWWGHGAVDFVLVTYLSYLRRQVRIETEIRQRRLARLNSARAHRRARRPMPEEHDVEVPEEPRREPVRVERKPPPASRVQRNAVVVDVYDEDPAFHELDDPGQLPFRRASGE